MFILSAKYTTTVLFRIIPKHSLMAKKNSMIKKSSFLSLVSAILILPILSSTCIASGFIHPLDFNGTEAEKAAVISYIQSNVKETYSKIGMDDPVTLRMMEKKELNAFKQLTKATNRNLLDDVIQRYCAIGMCNYTTILMMYNKQLKASSEKLKW